MSWSISVPENGVPKQEAVAAIARQVEALLPHQNEKQGAVIKKAAELLGAIVEGAPDGVTFSFGFSGHTDQDGFAGFTGRFHSLRPPTP